VTISRPISDPVTEPVADAVTGALPRAELQPRLEAEFARTARSGGCCSLFLFDVDFFKTVNDVFGHLRGDEALRQLVDRIKGLVRSYDVLFRYGGDEFVLLLPDTDATEAARLALRLTADVRGSPFPGEPQLHLSVSLGVATSPDDGTDPAALLERADRRNYLAKRRGRGSAVADDADTGAADASTRLWERDAALAATHEFLTRLQVEGRGTLRVHGQPGAGHTRFLDEVATIARLRGFAVVPVPPAPAPLPAPPDGAGGGVLLLADLAGAARSAEVAARLGRGPHAPPVLGAVLATAAGDGAEPEAGGLPVLAAVELAPWSPAALRIWLRTTLRAEPSRTLVNWLASRSGGLPAAATRELARLRERQGLVRTGDGWTLSPAVLGRPRRRVRLPAQLTGLVGREEETGRVAALLAGARLVTLVGPGGIGKTRLSLAVAAAVAEDFDDGVVFVPLAETTETARVVSALALALQVGEIPGEPLLDTVADHLAEASMLLVVDNFEQVLDAGAVVGEVLAAAPGVSVLATSREPLALYGEHVHRVPPLQLPAADALTAGAAAGAAGAVASAVADFPAIALFDQRARAANADFALTPATLPAVVELCRRLDGLPLAIELAAARTDQLSPQALLARLTDHLDAPGTAARNRPERQQTLRGTLDWSYQLLAADQQQVFTALAAFTGGCTDEAALAVAGPPGARLDGVLTALADKSLLVAEPEPGGGGTRYRMLETVRAYAAARLGADPAADAVYRRHAGYYATLAERAATGLTGPEQATWTERIEREHENLRAATERGLAQGEVSVAARICLGLWRFWRHGSHIGDGRAWLDRVLAAGPAEGSAGTRARLLYAAAVLAATQDDHPTAYRLGTDCLELAEAGGDRETMAQAHNAMGAAAVGTADYRLAAGHLRRCLALFEELAQPQGTAGALGNLAKLSLRLGDLPAAGRYIDRCLQLERSTGNTFGLVLGLECRGQILLAQGDLPAARASLEDSLTLSRNIGDVYGEAMALHQLGLVAHREGNRQGAVTLLTVALLRRHEAGDREDLAVSLDSVAGLAVDADPALAARLLAAAERLRSRHRLPTPPDVADQRAPLLTATRAALGDRAFAAAWAGGRDAPLELVIDQVLDLSPEP
jgi:diguanylate cyclase (GGDEF)-like protein